MFDLPPNVYQRVFQRLSSFDQCVVARTCRSMQASVEKVIYNEVNVGYPKVTLQACQTISNCPRVVPYIRSFIIHILPDHRAYNYVLPAAYWEAIANALTKLTHPLDQLIIATSVFVNRHNYHPQGAGKPGGSWVIRGCKVQVRELFIPFMWDEDLLDFLIQQTDLVSLMLPVHAYDFLSGEDSLMEGSCPNLASYEGPALLTRTIIPGRPLTCCRLFMPHIPSRGSSQDRDAVTTSWGILQQIFTALAKSKKKIERVDFVDANDETSLDVLCLSVRSLPELRSLGGVSLSPSKRNEFYRWLTQLHHLNTLEVSISRFQSSISVLMMQSLALELHCFCRTLRTIYFTHGEKREMFRYRKPSDIGSQWMWCREVPMRLDERSV